MVLKELGEVALLAELPEDVAGLLLHVDSEQGGDVGVPRHPRKRQEARFLLKVPSVRIGN